MNHLGELISISEFREQPLELLTLSACQTAKGDDKAALGLAGIAVKTGARSALATLWSVNDKATAELVTAFYQNLKKNPALSKAQALQKAQQQLLQNPIKSHPYFWAPLLLIGNWL
jgi:CHAT domain-containing protein